MARRGHRQHNHGTAEGLSSSGRCSTQETKASREENDSRGKRREEKGWGGPGTTYRKDGNRVYAAIASLWRNPTCRAQPRTVDVVNQQGKKRH